MPADGHALWKGTLTFGLVSVPVALRPAVRQSQSRFHLVHRPDASRLERRMYCPAEKVFVHPEHILRGHEVEDGKYVVVEDQEIQSLAPKRSTTIEIDRFVDRRQIGSGWYDRPYYVVPTGAEKPYRLLVEVLGEMNKAGLCEFVMHTREHFACVLSFAGALVLITLRYPQQLRDAGQIAPKAKAESSEVKKMRDAIQKTATDFDPGTLEDPYQKRLVKLIQKKKRKGQTVEAPQDQQAQGESEEPGQEETTDLVAALEASLRREKSKGS